MSEGRRNRNVTGSGLVEILGAGIFAWKGLPSFGRQDLGYTPDGAQDRCSFLSGNILLGNPTHHQALELVVPPAGVRFLSDCFFVLTGGRLTAELISEGPGHEQARDQAPGYKPAGHEAPGNKAPKPVEHAAVCFASAGSELRFGRRAYGFRTYLCVAAASGGQSKLAGRRRGAFDSAVSWPHPQGIIRVMDGPDRDYLVRPSDFFSIPWRTTRDVSAMGVRLAVGSESDDSMPQVRSEQLVSAPVCDGTIQMTPSGPIVLLRDRQTTGGYPRVFVVISPDIDLVAQYGPLQRIKFARVSAEEARRIGLLRQRDLQRLRERFPA